MKEMINQVLDGYKIFADSEVNLELAKKKIAGEYEVIKAFKESKRNYVALIEIDSKKYVLKEPRNEFRIPQRKFFTIFKKGESLTTLDNISRLVEEGQDFYVKPLTCGVKRTRKMISSSFIIFEYLENNESSHGYPDKIISIVKKMHQRGVFHGDCTTSNFMMKDNKVYVIDTQGKRMLFGSYRKHYDMISLCYYSYLKDMTYPYKKDSFYYLAFSVKKFKRFKLIKAFKSKKKELRDKGWKI